MESSSVPAAGWFVDPAGSGGQRWWSGASWTEHVRPTAHATVPAPAVPAKPVVSVAPSVPAAPAATMVAERPSAPAFTLSPPAPSNVVGFTSQVDPAIANRYRSARVEEEVEELALAAPAAAKQPNQLGWQGKPLPNDAGYLSVAGFGSAPAGTAPGAYSVPERANPISWTALGSGALALGIAVFFLLFNLIGLWPAVLAVAAIAQGSIGAVRSRRSGSGIVPSMGGILLGIATIAVMGGALVSAFSG